MAFKIPNASGAFDAAQGMPDETDFDIIAQGIGGEGVVSGCAVSAQTPAAMAVDIASGTVRIGGTNVAVTSGAVNVSAAHATLPRVDLVVVNNSGTKAIQTGTAASVPELPAVPVNTVALAAVMVKPAVTTIVAGALTDKRAIVVPPASDAVRVMSVQVFAATGTWTKPAGLISARVVVIGGGGGGGGCDNGPNSAGGGGGGGYSEETFAAADLAATEPVTVGAGGAAGAGTGGTGGTGGTSSFGSPAKLQATGGVGGVGESTATGASQVKAVNGGDGGLGSNGNINASGGPGGFGIYIGDGWGGSSGPGGNTALGGGGKGRFDAGVGTDGLEYGGGGGGARAGDTTNRIGGEGAPGVVIVYEFKSQ